MFRILVALTGTIILLVTRLGGQAPLHALHNVTVVHLAPAPGVVAQAPNPGQTTTNVRSDDLSRAADQTWTASLNAGEERAAMQNGAPERDADVRVRVSTDRSIEGGDQYVYILLRNADDLTTYRARL